MNRAEGVVSSGATLWVEGPSSSMWERAAEAAGELGYAPGSFDRMLEKALVSLLATPDDAGGVAMHPRGAVGYAYADEDLESLTNAQKHLLRMGPRNARLIKDKLREIAAALGVGSR